MPVVLVIIVAIFVWFFDIWPFYSGHFRPLDRQADYNVKFYYEDNSEEILGTVTGINGCRFVATENARKKNIKDTKWTYRCCRVLRSNSCDRIEM